MNGTNSEHLVSKGVDQLIERLRVDGVEAGQQQASDLIAEAKQQAGRIVDEAQQQADAITAQATQQATNYQRAAENALKTAMRDMVLTLKADLAREFGRDVNRLVSAHISKPELLQQIILELVGRVDNAGGVATSEDVQVILPEHVIGLDALRNDPKTLEQSPLTDLVLGLTSDMLKAGVSFGASEDLQAGLKIHLRDHNLEIDLSEDAVSNLLLAHLQPRFRAILEGVVR